MEQNIRLETAKRRKNNIVVTVVLLMMLTPAIGTAILFAIISRQTNQVNAECKAHMTTLGAAFIAYAKKHNDTLPPATNWAKSIEPYVSDARAFRCPNDLTKGFTSYAMNDSLGGKKLSSLKEKPQLVLLYEVDKAGDSPNGDGKNIHSIGHDKGGEGRHGGNFYRFNFFLFADGNVRFPKAFRDTYSYYWQNGVKPKPAPVENDDNKHGMLF